MQLDLQNLPEDFSLLRQIILDLLSTLDEKDRRIETLKHQLAQLQRYQFGRKSEKIALEQLLFQYAGLQTEPRSEKPSSNEKEESPAEPQPGKRSGAKGHGRSPLPEHLPRHRIEYPLSEEACRCQQCGEALGKIGEEITQQLDYQPASFHINEHVRIKYACRKCQGNMVISELPPQPIEKGLPGPGLLAHVLVSKYADHIPLHRLEGIFERNGLELSRKGRIWVYVGDQEHENTVYDYTPTRNKEGPGQFLEGYEGYLQADAYAGYDGLRAGGEVVEVGCWAHARRKFYEAQTSDRQRALVALAYLRQLYKVEKEARDRQPGQRQALRQGKARPVLEGFKVWLGQQQLEVLPKSPMGEAIGYAQRQWKALVRYLEDGDLSIDNNASERALRGVVVRRKNYLFYGSDAGGKRAAILYSFMTTCKRHRVDPFAYLTELFQRFPSHSIQNLTELFPKNWKAAQQAQLESVAA